MNRALITGSTGNVGYACMELAKREGWQAVGVSRGEGLDLTRWAEVNAWAENRRESFDLVVMAHGVQIPGLLPHIGPLSWGKVINNNLTSAAVLTSALMEYERVAPGGLVVYCSSIQATQPRAGRGAYAAAKAGLEGLMRAAAVEWAGDGVRAVALRLGQLTATMRGVTFDEAQAEAIKRYTPLPWVDPADVARLCFDLYRQPSLTGVVLEISSGHHLSVWPK
jgi:3-oxoacyl-[acyl-carrier protein] reductase